jgi:cytochrome c6
VKRTTVVLTVALALAARAASAADLAAAKDNFNTFCVKCHGTSGKGDGPSGATLKVKPRDFADCARMAKESDETLFKVIKEGGEANGYSKDMAPFKDGFDDSEIHDLVAYVRTFCKK